MVWDQIFDRAPLGYTCAKRQQLGHNPARRVDADIGYNRGITRCRAVGLRASHWRAPALAQIVVTCLSKPAGSTKRESPLRLALWWQYLAIERLRCSSALPLIQHDARP